MERDFHYSKDSSYEEESKTPTLDRIGEKAFRFFFFKQSGGVRGSFKSSIESVITDSSHDTEVLITRIFTEKRLTTDEVWNMKEEDRMRHAISIVAEHVYLVNEKKIKSAKYDFDA